MKPQNIIIAIVFLVLVSFFSFSFESITGNQILNTVPQLGIVNDVVKAGQPIQIRAKINGYCIDPKITFYDKRGTKKDTRIFKPTEDDCATQNFRSCKSNKYCEGNIKNDIMIYNYYTLPSWKINPGLYTVRIHYYEKVGQPRDKTPYVERAFRITS